MRRHALASLVCAAALGAAVAQAGFFEDIYRGFGLLATPSGSPVGSTSDGTRVNGARSGRLRIVPSGIGGGYQLEFNRTFGPDSQNRPETLHLGGLADLTLQGSVQSTLGYNGREFRTLRANTTVTNLTYDLRSKLGVQDAELVGQLAVNSALELNPLGFYNLNLNVSNANSQLLVDGVLVRDTDQMNFDVGPIAVRGNVFYDGLLALLTTAGVDTTQLETLTPHSGISEIDDALRNQLRQSSLVASDTAGNSPSELLVEAVLGQDGNAAQDLLTDLVNQPGQPGGDAQKTGPSVVPEPSTLLLMGLGAATLWYGRRRR